MKVFNDRMTREANLITIAVTAGRKGMSEAMGAVFPAAELQISMVHLIRNSLDHGSWTERTAVTAALTPIYSAPRAEAALAKLHPSEQHP